MYEYLDKRYALALYEVALEKGKVDEYLKDLSEIVDLAKSNDELIQIIRHPQVTTKRKKKIFINVFKDKIDEELLSFLLILIEKDRILFLEEKLKEMEKIHLERTETILAEVKTVIALTQVQREQLISKLKNKYGKKIILKEEIDKSIIGGIVVRVGNDLIDDTIKTKLEEMKKILLQTELR